MKEVKFNDEKMLDEEIEVIERLEEKNEFWCVINACGWNK